MGHETNYLADLSNDLANAVEAAEPAIVRVDARRRFGATGLIWREDGMIVTADHIIQREEDIKVRLYDGSEVPARLVGRDPGTDLAVLSITASGLTAVKAQALEVRVGHIVLALGRPRGERSTASLGIVSAITRQWRSWRGGSIEQIIRSDVTLYPGFSGGPLVGVAGNIIGMNTSALARGLATTIPWSTVSQVAEMLAEHGSIKRGYLGILTQPVELPESLQQSANLEHATALLIIGVESDSPAQQAGLMLGDILVGLGTWSISDVESLRDALGPDSAGAELPARVVRGGQLTQITITVGVEK